MEFPVGESRLEAMPNELLMKIMKFVGLDDALNQVHFAEYQATYNKAISQLLGLSLTSKRLEAVVRPVIYCEVLICRSAELVLLFTTLTENPRLGEYIKRLSFSATFRRQDPDHEFLDLDNLRGLDPDLDLILPESLTTMTSRQENDIRTILYLKVLEKAPKAEKVAMNTASWNARGVHEGRLAAFGIASIMAHRAVMPQIPLSRVPESLTTLYLTGDYRGLPEGLPRQISNFWCQGVSDEAKVKKLFWLRDDTTWFDSLPGQQWAQNGLRGQLTCLTTLHLIDTSCRFSDLAIVCDSFPSLKDLVVSSNFLDYFLGRPKTDERDGLSPGPTRLCLTRNISKLQHLESLRLQLAAVPDNRYLLGDHGGIDLSSLSRLKQAVISFRLFVLNKRFTLEAGTKYLPHLFLPQSLEKLGIVAHRYKCEAGGNLMEFLKGLHADCKWGYPRLSLIEYEYATGIPGLQTVDPRCRCVCASDPHEDHCTYDKDSELKCSFLPWVPAEEFQVLYEKFGQRGIKLTKIGKEGFVVTGRTITAAS